MLEKASILPPLTRAQNRRIHALWREWAGVLRLSPEDDRMLRHYYVRVFSHGHAPQTNGLTLADADGVIDWLVKLVRHREIEERENQAAGTAGREGFPEQRRVPPNAPAWRALFACVRALGMSRAQLDAFIQKHYGRTGLRRLEDVHTMADLNRVLWGLKAILRRGPGPEAAAKTGEKEAA